MCGVHGPAASTCLASGPFSLSNPQYGVQLYKNYQQAQPRHLRPSYMGSPPLVSVHRSFSLGGHSGPVLGTHGPCSDPSPSYPIYRGVSLITPWWPWTSLAMLGVSSRTPGKL